ncbi:MAG: hypothetical protein AB7S26_18620 [Sandaracinaceae bacterium]
MPRSNLKITLLNVALASIALAACGSEEEEATITVASDEGLATAELEASAPAAAPAVVVATPPTVEPAHDGTVVMAGEYPVEVVADDGGSVYAYVRDEELPPADVTLTVEVPVEGRDSARPVVMVWNPAEARWVGRVHHLTIVPGPIDVVLGYGGVDYRGHGPTFVVVAPVAPAVVVTPVVPAVHVVGPHVKHKHRGHGHGWGHGPGHGHGHGHGPGGVRIRVH